MAAARAALEERGVEFMGDIFDTGVCHMAFFADPDGNQWQLQEVTERLPGRVEPSDPAELAQLLLEAATAHGAFEAIAPPHNWWDWYSAYMDARQAGSNAEQATAAADRYMAEAHGVVVSR